MSDCNCKSSLLGGHARTCPEYKNLPNKDSECPAVAGCSTAVVERNAAKAQAPASKRVSGHERVVSFATEDVLKVAKTLIDDAVYWDNDENYSMNSYPGYCCSYCSMKRIEKYDDIKHDLDCPVLIAIDLTTGS